MHTEQNPSPATTRYAALDTWRFIAAMGVVAYHYENHFASIATAPSHKLAAFGHFVDFFFVLSGFVLMHTYGARIGSLRDYGRFMQKRLARIYPLHALVTLIFGALAIGLAVAGAAMRAPQTMDPALIAPHMLMIHSWGPNWQPGLNFPSWSISAEFFLYLVFPALALIVLRCGAALSIAIAIAFAAGMEWLRLKLGMGSFTEATWDFGMLRALPSFLAGMAVQRIVTALPPMRISWLAPHCFMLGTMALMFAQVSIYIVLCAFVIGVGLIAAAERGGEKTFLQSAICIRLGDASYAVYLLHTMFQVATLALARKLGVSDWPSLVALAIFGSAAILATSVACYAWFENPARRFFSRPLDRWFASQRSAASRAQL